MIKIKSTLFALNKDGSFQEWNVFVDGATVLVQFGKLDGKIQTKKTICESKNVGRSNETTPEQQAILEAEAKWDKQYRLGYRESTNELVTVEQFSPMLAHDAIKRSHDIIYPCYAQPKLDGLRCLVTFDEEGNSIFNTRGNKTYPIIGKIKEQIEALREKSGYPMFDGEVYLHGLSLQKIVSLAKKWRTHEQIEIEIDKDFEADKKRQAKAIKDGQPTYKNFAKKEVKVEVDPVRDSNRYGGYESADLKFHIFDIPSATKQWYIEKDEDAVQWADCRLTDLQLARLDASGSSHLVFVEGMILNTEAEVKDWIARFMQDNYEGIIIRNFIGVYEFGQRSQNMQKWKIFQTVEAYVFDYEIDKNDEVVLICRLQNGVVVRAKMKGDHNYRKNNMNLVGSFITISFQAYTEDGVPQFPVGVAERDVDPVTWEVRE